ncbi:unnamed protein product [Pleuronectes platessa]|uniref:Uncharacterized protein n=1 Tax=Pleuronectes platessa TaxID=8262 RepID=A0A9N7UTX8_PLEPL|nr:unnamed protein product [Pleuronectes platessa]
MERPATPPPEHTLLFLLLLLLLPPSTSPAITHTRSSQTPSPCSPPCPLPPPRPALTLAGYGAFHGGLSTSSVFRRLCPWQGNKQAPRERSLRGVEVAGTVTVDSAGGCRANSEDRAAAVLLPSSTDASSDPWDLGVTDQCHCHHAPQT